MSLYYERLYNKVVSVQVQVTPDQWQCWCLPSPGPGPPLSQWTWRGGRSMRQWTMNTTHLWNIPMARRCQIYGGSDRDRDPSCLELISAEISLGPFLSHPTKEYLAWGDGAQLLMISIHNTVVLAYWVAITYDCKLYYDGIQHWINKVYSQDAVSL